MRKILNILSWTLVMFGLRFAWETGSMDLPFQEKFILCNVGVVVSIVGLGLQWFVVRLRESSGANHYRAYLIENNKAAINAANVALYMVMIGCAWVYVSGMVDDKDWRGMGVAFALMFFLPLAVLLGVSTLSPGKRFKEALISYAYSNGMNPSLYCFTGVIAICLGCFAVAESL